MMRVMLTGASTGIGAAILARLGESGRYETTVLGRSVPGLARNCRFIPVDLSDPHTLEAVIEPLLQTSGPFDVLINNAGVGVFKPVEELTLAEWQRVINLNLTAPFALIRKLLPGMRALGSGRIVNISSDADHIGFAGAGAYCASKFGLAGLAEAVRKELTGSRITIVTIAPARVDTCFNGKAPGDRPLALSPADVAAQVIHVIEGSDRCHVETIRLKSCLE
jgi:3-oxoacyl-[acyl-carrier protein] reductase